MKKPDLRFWRNPRLRYGGLSTLLLCVALALLIALNALFSALESRHGWRVDCSFNSITTYSDVTEEVIAALDTPVSIYALYERGQEDQPLLELLARYCAASAFLTWAQTPLSLYPDMVARYAGTYSGGQVSSGCIVVECPATGRFRVLTPVSLLGLSANAETNSYEIDSLTYEKELTTAISYVTQEKVPVVWVLQGHGEIAADGAAYFTQLLMDNHYDMRFAPLASMDLQPDDLLVILSPQSDLTQAELEGIVAFADAGGSLLITISPYDSLSGTSTLPGGMPHLRELLRLYSAIPLEGIVSIPTEDNNAYISLNGYLSSRSVTAEMQSDGIASLPMMLTGAFQTPGDDLTAPLAVPILMSDENTRLLSLPEKEFGASGPFTLGLESQRISSTGEVSRAVILGSPSLLTSTDSHSNVYIREFIVRIADHLVDNESDDLSIAPKVAFRPRLSADALSMGSMMLVALPLTILAAALIVLYPRRHL